MLRVWVCFALFAMGSAPGAQFHFAIVGDRTGRAVPGVYEEVWRQAASAKPDFIMTVGDAIEGWNDGSATGEWEAVRRNWPGSIPVYHTPGNHDIWSTASERVYVEETGRKPFYSFDFRQAHLVVLDNSRTEDLSPDQLRFLESDLKQNRGKAPILVFFHRPFWLLPLKLRASDFTLHRLARQYGICCVVSGHGHQFQSVSLDGILYLEVGSSGASLAGAGPAGTGYDDGWFYQYVYASVEGSSVTFEVRELGPPWGKGRIRVLHAGATR